jgi:hypothetical protein
MEKISSGTEKMPGTKDTMTYTYVIYGHRIEYSMAYSHVITIIRFTKGKAAYSISTLIFI